LTDRKHTAVASVCLAVLDGLVVFGSFSLAYWIRMRSGILPFVFDRVPAISVYATGMVFTCLVTVIVFRFFGLYRMPRSESLYEEIFRILKAMTLAMLIAMAATFLYRGVAYSRLVFIIAWGIGLLAIWLERILVRRLQAWALERGFLSRRVAIVGAGEMARMVMSRIRANPGLGMRVEGYVGNPGGELRHLGGLEELGDIVGRRALDTLVVALPFSEHERLLDVLRQTEGLRVEVRFVPDLFGLVTSRTELHDLDGIPLIGLKPFPLDPWGRVVKRAMDIVLSGLFLAAFSPLMALIALLIRLDSPGDILYRQERMGRDGRRFTMYKFRSLEEDAEKEGPVWGKGTDDPRSTVVGRVLRKTGLDEVPQMYNVLRGEMSLIGPRPERPCFVDQFAGAVPGYLDRHRVKSGVTGWAQVNGFRGDTSIETRTEYDIYYVENWSVSLDLRIMLMTVRYLLREALGRVGPEMET
jgi:exopolysaccharide biosynthesis polyprenyl glycosylphosphotransferase